MGALSPIVSEGAKGAYQHDGYSDDGCWTDHRVEPQSNRSLGELGSGSREPVDGVTDRCEA